MRFCVSVHRGYRSGDGSTGARRLHCHRSHCPATTLTTSAQIYTTHHRFISTGETRAIISAFFAQFCANATVVGVVLTHSEHEVGRGDTRLSTITEDLLML